MGLFKKKKNKKDNQYTNYNQKGPTLTSFDNMVYIIARDNSDEQLLEICDTILGGKAVLANFNKIDPANANIMLSFISGVVYAKEGEIFKLESKLFLFARKEEFEDGSLYQYVEDTK